MFRASWRHTPVAVKVLTGMALHPAAVQELHEVGGRAQCPYVVQTDFSGVTKR